MSKLNQIIQAKYVHFIICQLYPINCFLKRKKKQILKDLFLTITFLVSSPQICIHTTSENLEFTPKVKSYCCYAYLYDCLPC